MSEFIRLSTRDYVHDEPDEGRKAYRGDLDERRPLTYSRQLAFWPWGGSPGSPSSGTIRIDNRSGLYDQMVFRDLRDQEITVTIPTEEGTEIRAFTGIVDAVTAVGEQSVDIEVKDRLSILDAPLQTQTYDDEADEAQQGRLLPITLGIARSVRPIVWQSAPSVGGPRLRLHDGSLSGIFRVRFNGEPQLQTDSPVTWSIDADIGGGGIQLEQDYKTLVTLDCSSSGDAFLLTGPPDLLNGAATFTDFGTVSNALANPNDIDGWEWEGQDGPVDDTDRGFATASYRAVDQSCLLDAGNSRFDAVNFNRNYSVLTHVDGSDVPLRVLEAGKTYRWSVNVTRRVQYYTYDGGQGIVLEQGTFVIRAMRETTIIASRAVPLTSEGEVLFLRTMFGADNTEGTFTGTFTVPTAAGSQDRYLQVGCFFGGECAFKDLIVYEVPPPPPDTLEGITLKDYALEIARRSGLPDSDINTADLDAIDPNEEDIGVHFAEPVTALAALRAPLDTFGADVYTDRDGAFRFARIRDPAGEIPALIVDVNNISERSRISVEIDKAPGLSTSMSAARNWYVYRDSDFEDETTVSLEDREILKRDARFIRNAITEGSRTATGTGTGSPSTEDELPRIYRHAINAEPLNSVFDKPEAAAAEIQRIIDIYSTIRFFVEVEIYLDAGEFLDVNEVVLFKYPRFNFGSGRNMIVAGISDTIEDMGRRRSASLLLWG